MKACLLSCSGWMLGLLLLGAGCAPDASGRLEAWVVDVEGDRAGLFKRPVTVTSLQRLQGPGLSVRVGAEPAGADDGWDFAGGHDLWLDAHRVNGAYRAADLDGLSLLSFYAHAQAAHDFFRSLGLGEDGTDLPPMRIEYLPVWRAPLGIRPVLTDNAAYDPTVRSFVLFRQSWDREGVALSASPGVTAHEFGHAVTDHQWRWARGIEFDPSVPHTPVSPAELAIEEGLSDLYASLFTGRSLATAETGVGVPGGRRDLAVETVFTAEMKAELTVRTEDFDPYLIGDVMAGALWALRGKWIDGGMEEAEASARAGRLAFEAVRDTDPRVSGFGMGWFIQALASGAHRQGDGPVFCEIVVARFQLLLPEIPTCQP